MIFYLKQYDKELLSFEFIEDSFSDERINILNVNEDYKHLLPFDLEINNESLFSWLKHRVIPKNRINSDVFF